MGWVFTMPKDFVIKFMSNADKDGFVTLTSPDGETIRVQGVKKEDDDSLTQPLFVPLEGIEDD